MRLAEVHGLRAYDAVQLAAALEVNGSWAPAEPFPVRFLLDIPRQMPGIDDQAVDLDHRCPPLSPEILQLSVHCLDRELLRVELAADPFLHVPVVRVLRVGYRFQEIGVAPDTAAVLGRASPGSFSAPGILDLGLWLNNSLKLDAVLPAISEVVLIDKPGVLAGLDDLAQQDTILVFHLHAEVQVVEICFTVVFVVDDKLMHVAVLPAHDGLDDLVKIAQGAVWHLNPPPDGGLAVHERDLELIYLACSFGGCGVRFWF